MPKLRRRPRRQEVWSLGQLGKSLSGRLLLLTVLIVMVIEVLIFVPSVARFRADFLMERLRMAELASLALLATPEAMLDPEMEAALLSRADVASIALRQEGARVLVLAQQDARTVAASYNLAEDDLMGRVVQALATILRAEPRLIGVSGVPHADAGFAVEVTLDETTLIAEMRAFGFRILWLSLLISVGTAGLIWFLVQRLLVRPMGDLVGNMAAFRDDPEDAARVMRPTSRVAEIALAEVALADMQTQVREALRERGRLASLGEAVARIAHDLRNMLATTQILADRIDGSRDPAVRRVGPKLVGSLDRAIALCESTLRFGRAEEAEPVPRRIALRALVGEIGDSVLPEGHSGAVRFENAVPEGLVVEADPDQLFRVLANLVRNAGQAIEAKGGGGLVRVAARLTPAGAEIDVADTGPGLPTRALENLFKPFRGGVRKGGFGLGLAIAHDLTALQGGRLRLVSSTTDGTLFRIALPPTRSGPAG